ncbi:hypothetical protein U1Q18_038192 [Sarracenia purpurea var. burkii]
MMSEDCREIIKENWEKMTSDSGLKGVRNKLELVGRALSRWNRLTFGHIGSRIIYLREELAQFQASSMPFCNQDVEENMAKELEELLVRE